MKRFLILMLRVAKVVAALVALLLLAGLLMIGWIKWSSARDWQRVQSGLKAKGEKLTFAELIPPPPPDSENFFADPIWRGLTDLVPTKQLGICGEYTDWEPRLPANKRLINQWQTPLSASEKEHIQKLLPKETPKEIDEMGRAVVIRELGWEIRKSTDPERRKKIASLLLTLLQPAEPLLAKITELSKRPLAAFPIRWEDGAAAPLPQIAALLSLGQVFSARSRAELELGNSPAASADALTLLRLSCVEKYDPLLIAHLVRLAILQQALSVINSGIERNQWTDAELADFQKPLESTDLVVDFVFVLRGERAFFNYCTEHKPTRIDRINNTWDNLKYTFLTNCLWESYAIIQSANANYIQHAVELIPQERPRGLNATTSVFRDSRGDTEKNPLLLWYQAIQANGARAMNTSVKKTIEAQTQVSQTLIACALERYRLAHGSYPASLDLLVPESLGTIPKEPTTGRPMQYRLLSAGKFLLWSPGWKLRTLDGKPGEFSGEGDIVWNLPLPREERKSSP